METLHDVLRFIVNRLRGAASDQAIEQALAVIAAHEAGQPAVSATPATFAEAFPQAADQLSRLDTSVNQWMDRITTAVGDLAAEVHAMQQPAQVPPTVPDPVPPASFNPPPLGSTDPVHEPSQGGF